MGFDGKEVQKVENSEGYQAINKIANGKILMKGNNDDYTKSVFYWKDIKSGELEKLGEISTSTYYVKAYIDGSVLCEVWPDLILYKIGSTEKGTKIIQDYSEMLGMVEKDGVLQIVWTSNSYKLFITRVELKGGINIQTKELEVGERVTGTASISAISSKEIVLTC